MLKVCGRHPKGLYYVVGAWQQMPHLVTTSKGCHHLQPTGFGASAPPKRQKGAGAGDALKLLVRHNIDFCATCCSWFLGVSKLAHPGEHHPWGVAANATFGDNKGCHHLQPTGFGASAPPKRQKGAGAGDALKLFVVCCLLLLLLLLFFLLLFVVCCLVFVVGCFCCCCCCPSSCCCKRVKG